MSAFQGSPDWLAQRAGRITGSRVAAALGVSKYATRDDLMREMVREHFAAEREFAGNEATEHGQAHEDDAIDLYEQQTGQGILYTGQHIHPEHDWLAASPDGLVGSDGLIEVKCPYRGTYTTAADVPHYIAQMQLQMAVTGRKWCDFVIWRDDSILIDRVDAEPFWLDERLPTLQAFIDEYRATIASEELSARHLMPLIREDKEWAKAERNYLLAKRDVDEATLVLEEYKAELIALAGEQSQKGRAVQVIRSERKGSVAYAKAIAELAPDADLTKYTGKPSVVYTVKECK